MERKSLPSEECGYRITDSTSLKRNEGCCAPARGGQEAVMERDVHLCSGGSVADGAGSVHDDRDLVVFAVKDGEGTEMQAADVGHDSRETGRDALLGEKLLESGEKFVDFIGGLEPADVLGKLGDRAGGLG
jgi:hypothetical protein